ncbi:MAG: transposase [Armatimonadetes bacterium]|nr:transposase [Armatimonadota bacterium]
MRRFLAGPISEMKLAVYRQLYNEQRPHSSLGYLPPAVAAAHLADFGRATPSLRPQSAVSISTEDYF